MIAPTAIVNVNGVVVRVTVDVPQQAEPPTVPGCGVHAITKRKPWEHRRRRRDDAIRAATVAFRWGRPKPVDRDSCRLTVLVPRATMDALGLTDDSRLRFAWDAERRVVITPAFSADRLAYRLTGDTSRTDERMAHLTIDPADMRRFFGQAAGPGWMRWARMVAVNDDGGVEFVADTPHDPTTGAAP
jgi:hypothetical protein